jgi:hypothetical protein
MKKITRFLLVFSLASGIWYPASLFAQLYSRYNHPFYVTFDREAYAPAYRFHTSLRPLMISELNEVTSTDSILRSIRIPKEGRHKWLNWLWNKAANEDLLILDKPDVNLNVNLLFDFGTGYDFAHNTMTWQNTRGFMVEGTIVKQVSFSTGFLENQALFVPYLDSITNRIEVVPGQGGWKAFHTDAYDYSQAFGYVSYSPSRYFNVQLGYGKNFIGDGYRSLLLSDASFNYPFLKASANFWHIKYMVIYAQFINRQEPVPPGMGYAKKYGVFHYLDWAITRRLNVGLFDAVIWSATDTAGNYRGFDWSYASPVIFLRPAEFSVGSPDNAVLGLNASMKVAKKNVFYGQFCLDEFKLGEIMAGNGWYANKWAVQLGFKSFDLFRAKNLYFQTEVNIIRPFTYSHWTYANYAHYSQPLAHPVGANLWESVTFLKYHVKRWYFNDEFQYYVYGADTANTNYGGDIFKFYTTYTKEYGNTITQGLKNKVMMNELVVSYLLNPATNMNLSVGFVYRVQKTDRSTYSDNYIYIALRTSLSKWVTDL